MMTDVRFRSDREQAMYFRAGLLLGLLPGRIVVAWADEVIARSADPSTDLIELATTDPGDITSLRCTLFNLGGDREPPDVIRALLALVASDLDSGRRSLGDTMTVLRQLRSFLKLEPLLADALRTLAVDYGHREERGERAVEERIRAWLKQYEQP